MVLKHSTQPGAIPAALGEGSAWLLAVLEAGTTGLMNNIWTLLGGG
jgi:hypothetical protein